VQLPTVLIEVLTAENAETAEKYSHKKAQKNWGKGRN
jgi:hypothetical protein